jgi:hypothetical protein
MSRVLPAAFRAEAPRFAHALLSGGLLLLLRPARR